MAIYFQRLYETQYNKIQPSNLMTTKKKLSFPFSFLDRRKFRAPLNIPEKNIYSQNPLTPLTISKSLPYQN